MKTRMNLSILKVAILSLTAGLGTVQGANLLLNPGFATPLTSADWSTTSTAIFQGTPGTAGSSHDGDGYVLKFDIASLPSSSTSMAYQTMAAQPGELWTFSGWALNPSKFQIGGSTTNFLEIVFTSNGQVVGGQSTKLDSSMAADRWIEFSASGNAPAGTTAVTFRIDSYKGPDGANGLLFVDDMNATKISPVPEPYVGLLAAAVPVLAILVGWGKAGRRAR